MSPKPSLSLRILNFFSGLGLATTLLVLLMVETWLATLEMEMPATGLYNTLQKYFDPHHWYVLPDAGIMNKSLTGKYLPPLPGGYWICALLALNILLGGIARIRKSWKNIGVLVAHCGIVVMIVSGGVAKLFEERGSMVLANGQTSDFAKSAINADVEIREVRDGKPTGPVHLISDKYFRDLDGDARRKVRLPALPFDIDFQKFVRNAQPVYAASKPPEHEEPVVDGWYLASEKPHPEEEMNTPGVHVALQPRDGGGGKKIALLAYPAYEPLTYRVGDRTFLIRLNRQVWPVPFKVRLDQARATYFPNTDIPRSYESNVTRIENGVEEKVLIEMNTPMRRGGLTFYQQSMDGVDPGKEGKVLSGLEVVKNPSDAWPKYDIAITGAALLGHFLFKLVTFIFGTRTKKKLA